MTTLPDLDPEPRAPVVPAPRVFMIDNYDSFTYNLVQELGELGAEIIVKRNDRTTLDDIDAERPTHLVVSPGPCTPNEAGISLDAIRRFGAEGLPVLGVCLGHQAIGQVYGGTVRRAGYPVHGKTDDMSHDGRGVFAGLPDPFTATRYHSLVVDEHLPSCLELSAWNQDGIVMGVRHRELPVHGVQFHPESVLTGVGLDLLRTFLVMGRDEVERRPPGPGRAARAPAPAERAPAGTDDGGRGAE
jgi:anthranilate synthase/aminodeoxychorismate synthase-like glutamine amidotransferase